MSEQLQFDVPNYVTVVKLQETTDGNYCYVAFHPELPNVISQGNTAKEAEENLIEATELTIAHLVSNDLPVPEPKSFKPTNISDLPAPRPTSFEFNFVKSPAAPRENNQEVMTVPSGYLVEL